MAFRKQSNALSPSPSAESMGLRVTRRRGEGDYRRDVRRATPATLTGDNGRPTSAWAVEMKLSPPGLKGPTTNSSPPNKVAPTSKNKLNLFNIIILHLQS